MVTPSRRSPVPIPIPIRLPLYLFLSLLLSVLLSLSLLPQASAQLLRDADRLRPLVALSESDLHSLPSPLLISSRQASSQCRSRRRAFFGVTVFFGRSYCAQFPDTAAATAALLNQMTEVADTLGPACITLVVTRIEGYCSTANDPFTSILATTVPRETLAALRSFWLPRVPRSTPPLPATVVLLAGGPPSAATFQAGACGPLTGLSVVHAPTTARLVHTLLLNLGATYGSGALARGVATSVTGSDSFGRAAVAEVQRFVDSPFGDGCFFETLPFRQCDPGCTGACFGCSGAQTCGEGICTQLSGGVKNIEPPPEFNVQVIFPTPSPSPSASPSPSMSASPSPSDSPAPSPSPSAEPSPTPSKSARPSPTPSESAKPLPSKSPRPSPSSSAAASPSPSKSPRPSPSISAAPSPSPSKSPRPSRSPKPSPSRTPRPSKSPRPSPSRTPRPSKKPRPTPSKTPRPSRKPRPSRSPSPEPILPVHTPVYLDVVEDYVFDAYDR